MAEATIPVDMLNPGQVFACLGFLEAADILLGNARGGFDWTDEADIRFRLTADGDDNPFDYVLKFVLQAERASVSPSHDIAERDGWNTDVRPDLSQCEIYKRTGKLQNALLPVRLAKDSESLTFEYWADEKTGKSRLSLWTATNGNSARVRLEKLMTAATNAKQSFPELAIDPFNASAVVAANYRLELRRNWVSLDLGFSPDKLNKGPKCLKLHILTYPFVELLAAFGLNHARPASNPDDRLQWSYFAWQALWSPAMARAALSGQILESQRQFRMVLDEPNDGGDLSISNAYEVTRR